MQNSILFLLGTLLCWGCNPAKEVRWISTTVDSPWTENNSILSIKKGKMPAGEAILIGLDDTLQQIDGFGGCFNELGWEALQTIPEEARQTILHDLFDPATGCKFNICRMPIGANDYAVDWYSHNEVPGDYAMKHFSIERDQQLLIPYIHEAQKIRPDLKIWASPWCPPTWMKTNNHYACRADRAVNDLAENRQGKEMENQFIMDEPTLSAYALYFSRFINAYQQEGIEIYAVHVQNEPNSCQNFPSCVWTPSGLATFIGQYLGPQLAKDKLQTEIWLGTIERPQIERVDAVLQDSLAGPYIRGVGFQWAGKGAIPLVHKKYPETKLMQTETECGDGSNDWKAMEHTWSLMKHYFNNGANAYMYWNMVLDETGKSQWGWKQNSMISISSDQKVTYNPEFYLMKHFSSFIKPSARFVKTGNSENCLAFLNPDHELVIIYYNEKDEPTDKIFTARSERFVVNLPGKSLHTFCIQL